MFEESERLLFNWYLGLFMLPAVLGLVGGYIYCGQASCSAGFPFIMSGAAAVFTGFTYTGFHYLEMFNRCRRANKRGIGRGWFYCLREVLGILKHNQIVRVKRLTTSGDTEAEFKGFK